MTSATRIDTARTIVLKIGSALLVDGETGTARTDWLAGLAEDCATLIAAGKQLVIVSSGAIALGRKTAGIDAKARPSAIPLGVKQAAASIGQIALMQSWQAAFAAQGITVSQILLTQPDTENRRAHLNITATIRALLDLGIVPVVNENDTISTAEIRYGDNDRLAARVAQIAGADLLIQLSTTDGLYTGNPDTDDDARHIPEIEAITPEIVAMAGDAAPGLSTGGMTSKLAAARIAGAAGIPMLIASGRMERPLAALLDGRAKASLFHPAARPAAARKRFIAANVTPGGALHINDGAAEALRKGGSLLPVGVTSCEGTFERGDAVEIRHNGTAIATGLASYGADAATLIAGRRSAETETILGYTYGDELVHRDNLVLRG